MENKNYKPFDLAKAKAGAKVMTRDGKAVEIIKFDRKDEFHPIVALVTLPNGKEKVQTYTEDGSSCFDIEVTEYLVMCPEKHEGWVNIYSTVEGCRFTRALIYESKAEAIHCGEERYDYVTTTKIEWEE